MDDRLRELMQSLGSAINESLSDCDRIAEAIEEIKRAGYDVFLVLEVTVGFNKRQEGGPEEAESEIQEPLFENGKVRFTSQDKRFMKALKITPDDLSK